MTNIEPSALLLLVAVLGFLEQVRGDCYMQNPPGSNNRNREENQNRQNANRLFDSQNNGAGGYPWRGDPNVQGQADELHYYPGSILRVEWTVQHGCGPDNNVECEMILQYACDDSLPHLRDGYPTGPAVEQNGAEGFTRASFVSQDMAGDGTSQIPLPVIPGSSGDQFDEDDANFGVDAANRDANLAAFYRGETVGNYRGIEFGMHEHYDYYRTTALRTERNRGLYTADRNLGGESARYTRQNNGGTRRGLEVPEERDYYPYWNPSPWRDIAVLTSDMNRCPYYQQHSQNVEPKWACVLPEDSEELAPISERACRSVNGEWTEFPAWGSREPDCLLHSSSRDNHLGNSAVDAEGRLTTAFYDWRMPTDLDVRGRQCVLRLRYNMSATNFPSHSEYLDPVGDQVVDASWNCQGETGAGGRGHCGNSLAIEGMVPLYDDPFVKVYDDLPHMGLAINTAQIGRTFQDRSYVFSIREDEPDTSCSEVWNLNVRGRRGNIVQAYPATEYDFVPTYLDVTTSSCVAIGIHSSDFNSDNAAGEGTDGTDASNIVQIVDAGANHPVFGERQRMFSDQDARELLMVGQDPAACGDYSDDDGTDNESVDNCGKLNARVNTYEHSRLIQFETGSYTAISTRNNNFSNRSQKLHVHVRAAMLLGSIGAIVAVSVIAAVFSSAIGLAVYGFVRPQSSVGKAVSGLFRIRRDGQNGSRAGASQMQKNVEHMTASAPPAEAEAVV